MSEREKVLEEVLREWMVVADLAKDLTFVPTYKRTEALLSKKVLPLGHEFVGFGFSDGSVSSITCSKCLKSPATHLPAEPAPRSIDFRKGHSQDCDCLLCVVTRGAEPAPPDPVAQESEHVDVFARTLQKECFSSDGADIGKAAQMIAAHDAAIRRESERAAMEKACAAACRECRDGIDSLGVAGRVNRSPIRKYAGQWDHESLTVPGLWETCMASPILEAFRSEGARS